MSVRALEKQICALPRHQLRRFSEWFDTFRGQDISGNLRPETSDYGLSEAQKQEILRRALRTLLIPRRPRPGKAVPSVS
jgi:hypothetical protein